MQQLALGIATLACATIFGSLALFAYGLVPLVARHARDGRVVGRAIGEELFPEFARALAFASAIAVGAMAIGGGRPIEVVLLALIGFGFILLARLVPARLAEIGEAIGARTAGAEIQLQRLRTLADVLHTSQLVATGYVLVRLTIE
jgi:hypothetical protein